MHITKSNGLGEFPSVVMYFDETFLKTVSLFCWGLGSQDVRILVTPQDDDSFLLGSSTFPLPITQYQSKQRIFFTQLALRCVQYFRGNISNSLLCFCKMYFDISILLKDDSFLFPPLPWPWPQVAPKHYYGYELAWTYRERYWLAVWFYMRYNKTHLQ